MRERDRERERGGGRETHNGSTVDFMRVNTSNTAARASERLKLRSTNPPSNLDRNKVRSKLTYKNEFFDLLDIIEPLLDLRGAACDRVEGAGRTIGDTGRVDNHQAVLNRPILWIKSKGEREREGERGKGEGERSTE